MVNYQIRQFRDSLIAMTNACQLPIEIKRLVFAEIQAQINVESDKAVVAEKAEYAKAEEKKAEVQEEEK